MRRVRVAQMTAPRMEWAGAENQTGSALRRHVEKRRVALLWVIVLVNACVGFALVSA